jgi:NitT/TauT family transport system substrate-binding protein
MLPQPFATVALRGNADLKQNIDVTAAWEALDGAGKLVTGVTIVRKEFAEANPDLVEAFLADHEASAAYVFSNPSETAALVVKSGIIENEAVALEALPKCNVTFIAGADMKDALSAYLSAIFELNPAAVGGSLPGDGFYR